MIHQETQFVGIDTYTAPTRLTAGFLQQADNVLIEGGDVVTRPGVVGLLASAMSGGPIYEITSYRLSGNVGGSGFTTNSFLLVNGGGPDSRGDEILVFAQGGKLWRWNATTRPGSPTEILNGSGHFNFANGGMNVRMARYGKYLYGCDGVGPLFRVNLETGTGAGTASSYAAMVPPPTPTVSLSNTTIDDGSNPSVWHGYPAPSSPTVTVLNPSFETGTTYNSTTIYPIRFLER